jgi:DNA-binding phage protein
MAEQTLDQMIAEIQQNTAPEPKSQFGRTVLQGLTFKTADEIEAWLKTSTPDEYEQLVGEIRGNLDEYSKANPITAGAAEIGGAVLPAIIATIMSGGAAIPAIGAKLAQSAPRFLQLITKGLGNVLGTRNVNTLLGAATVGGVQGGLSGYGGGEGDATDPSRISGATYGATTGAVTGGGLNIAGRFAGATVEGIINFARKKYGDRAGTAVAREIQKLAQERGISAEEAYRQIQNGSLMVENVTLRDVLRTYRAEGGEAAEELRKGLADRPKTTSRDVREYLEETLGDTADENILKKNLERLGTLKKEASELYESDWANDAVPQSLISELGIIFQAAPKAFDEVEEAIRATPGAEMFFKLDEAGNVVVTGRPTIGQAETVRRAIKNRVKTLYDENKGTAAIALENLELRLRGLIDGISDDTKQARAKYNQMNNESDAFDAGRKVTTNNPDIDALEIEWDTALAMGDDAIKSFRLGVLSKLRNRLRSGQKQTVIRDMLDEEKSLFLLLEQVFPEQDIPEMLRRLSVAKEANDAATEILRQSSTAITSSLQKKAASNVDFGDLIMSPDLYGIARIAFGIMGKTQSGLTDAQKADFVRTLVRSNADEMKSIISDTNGYSNLERYITDAISGLRKTAPRAVIQMQDPQESLNQMMGAFGAQ